jgi:hypothetical protein
LFVEIVVTSGVQRAKYRRIRRAGVPTIEVHLKPEHAMLEPEQLQALIVGRSNAKHWTFHPAQVAMDMAFVRVWRERHRQLIKSKLAAEFKPRSTVPRQIRSLGSSRRSEISMRDKLQHNAQVEAFRQRYGRYPTIEDEAIGLFQCRR